MVANEVPFVESPVMTAHEGGVNAVKFNKDGSYCMSGGVDKMCKLWNPHNGRLIKVYKGHTYSVSDLCITSDNHFFASGGLDRTVFVWDVTQDFPFRKLRATAEVMQLLEWMQVLECMWVPGAGVHAGHTEAINCLAYGAENSILASGSYDGTLKLWDMKSRAVVPIMTLSGFKDSVTSVHIFDFSIVTGCVDGYVRTFDIRQGKETLECILRPITNVQVSADRNCLLVQTLDNTVRLMDRKTAELLNEYKAHMNLKYKVGSCLSPDMQWLVSGSEDAGVYVYDVLTARVSARLAGHRGCVTAVQYHPSLPVLLSAATDGTLRLWRTAGG